jgi:hypothetical protein
MIESLKKLSAEARANGQWLVYKPTELWMSPDKFDQAIERGEHIRSVGNFRLADPMERIDQINSVIQLFTDKCDTMLREISGQ